MPSRLIRYLPLLAALGLLFAWPLLVLVATALRTAPPGTPGTWTLAAFHAVAATPGLLTAALHSFALALAVAACALPLAAGLAFVGVRTDAPLRRCITPTALLLFATPILFYTISFSLAANPHTGVLNAWLRDLFGLQTPWLSVESWPGLVAVSAFKSAAFLYLFLLPSFRMLNAGQEEASLVSGATRLQTFLRIQLPALAPALTSGLIFVMAANLQSFDAVMVLGGGQNIDVLPTRIYELLNATTPPDYAGASLVSLVLVVAVGLLALLQWRLLGGRSFVSIGGRSDAQARLRLAPRARRLVGAAIAVYLLVALVLPLGALVLASLQPFPGLQGTASLQAYRHAAGLPGLGGAVGTTLWLGGGTALVAVLLAVCVVQAEQRLDRGMRRLLHTLLLIPVAMPGIVAAVAFTWAYIAIPGLRQLYGTAWLMGTALVVSLLPLTSHIVRSATVRISADLPAAARVAGAGPVRAWRQVVLPLVAPALLVAWYFCFLMVAGNLEVPLLMGKAGTQTLAVQIFTLYSRGQLGQTAALIVLMLGSLASAGVLLLLATRRRHPPPGAARTPARAPHRTTGGHALGVTLKEGP